jgi:hypothetical protein
MNKSDAITKALERLNKMQDLCIEDPELIPLITSLIRTGNEKRLMQINRKIVPSELQQIISGNPYKKATKEADGLLRVGITPEGQPVGFDLEGHGLISGITRSGKTCLLILLLQQAIKYGYKVWFFSRFLEESLLKILSLHEDILVFFPDGNIRINPFYHPSLSKQELYPRIVTNMKKAYWFGEGTESLILSSLMYLAGKYSHTNFFNLYNFLKSQKYDYRKRLFQDTFNNRTEAIINGPLGKIFNTDKGDFESLLRTSIIFPIGTYTVPDQIFFTNFLIEALYWQKLSVPSDIYHFLILDDMQTIADKSFEYRAGEGAPELSHLLSTVAKSKIFIFGASQIPSQLSTSIHSNSNFKATFRLGNGADIEMMQRSMGITEPEQKQYFYTLSDRKIIIKKTSGYTAPLLAIIPEIHFPGRLQTIEETKKKNEKILRDLGIKKEYHWNKYIIALPLPTPINDEEKSIKNEEKKNIKNDKDLLMDIYLHPYLSITEHYKNLDLSAGKGNAILKALIRSQLCTIETINTGGRGGITKFLVLTDKGYAVIGVEPKTGFSRGGGFEHGYWQYKISRHFKSL